jgi:hypothetical protein
VAIKSVQIREQLQALSDCIARAFPDAVLGDIEDESGIAVSSTRVRLPNEVVLSVANDLDDPATKFMVLRVSTGCGGRLPFEQCFEDGYGVSERLDAEAVFALVGKYASLPQPTLH